MSTSEPRPPYLYELKRSPEIALPAKLKLRPKNPEEYEQLRDRANLVMSTYLNHPDEPYNLQVHKIETPRGETSYKAILRNRALVDATPTLDVETEISEQAYLYYAAQPQFPSFQKRSLELVPGASVEWLKTGQVFVGVKNLKVAEELHTIGIRFDADDFELVPDNPLFDDEFHANNQYFRQTGVEALKPQSHLSVEQLADRIVAQTVENKPTIVTVSGRSGSGKSSLVAPLTQHLYTHHADKPVISLSTDDYHVGHTALRKLNDGKPWENWDAPEVYDLEAVRQDLSHLLLGKAVSKRVFDFGTNEPAFSGEELASAPIIILEGIYAGAPELADLAHLRYEIPTPLATAVGRRITRDLRERPGDGAFSSPQTMLAYVLETAEPAYQSQKDRSLHQIIHNGVMTEGSEPAVITP